MPSSANPTVSVIIPVYNVAPYIDECIQSVINQTYSNLEIIIIDDGSTDESGEICDSYAEKEQRIKVIHQRNKGLGAARNAGLDIAGGEIISFLDSDDAFAPEMIEKLVDLLTGTGADIAACGYYYCETEGRMSEEKSAKRLSGEKTTLTSINALQKLIQYEINFSVWNKLYRKELFNDIRFPEGRYYEDINLTAKIFEKAGNIALSDEILMFYRRRKNAITSTVSSSNVYDRIKAMDELNRFIDDRSPQVFSEQQIIKRTEAELSWQMYKYCQLMKDKTEESRNAQKLLRENILRHNKDIMKCGKKAKIKHVLFKLSPELYSIISQCTNK